ncbi:MAG: cobalamin biosynthesis protein CbiG [Clostridiales bacterium]|nr:cobalamin biosynthesis protein CbiG [Clostridiales bacterium]
MNIGLIAFSETGMELGKHIVSFWETDGHTAQLTRCPTGGLAAWTEAHFTDCDALLFLSSCGIAVRAVAPFVRSKTTDPAVLVMDELGTFCVSLLSGHLGGANALASHLATHLGAIAVITTATDIHGVFSVDDWARRQHLYIANSVRIKWIASRLLSGETIGLKTTCPIIGSLPSQLTEKEEDYDILISHRLRGRAEALRLVPPVAALGVGCRKGVTVEALEEAYERILARTNCHNAAVYKVCSIDLKAREPGLLTFCERHHLPFETYSASELASLAGDFTGSAFVTSVTGVDNVCERSALRGCGKGGRLIAKKDAGNGVTMALALRDYSLTFGKEDAL